MTVYRPVLPIVLALQTVVALPVSGMALSNSDVVVGVATGGYALVAGYWCYIELQYSDGATDGGVVE